jgi:hypothetical protein
MLRALVLLLLAGVTAAGPRAGEFPFRVVVHASNPVASVTRAELSAIYMKRRRSWPDGREIVAYVTRYWQRLIFSGRAIPPREVRSDAAVLELVRADPEAIGYVRGDTPLGDGVKAIAVRP